MGPVPPLELRLGDVLVMKKPHPCGSLRWSVVRLGADIGLECETCKRRVLMPRPYLERRVKQVVRAPEPPPTGAGA
jgi:hypothetical protein